MYIIMSERTAIFSTDFINQFNNLQSSDAINTPVGAILQFAGQTAPLVGYYVMVLKY